MSAARGRKIRRRLLVLGVLIIVVAVVGSYGLDHLAKVGAEVVISRSLGVKATVENSELSVREGTLTMNGLRVANPEGYAGEYLLIIDKCDIEVDASTLLEDAISIRRFELDGLTLNVERKPSGTNSKTVRENLREFEKEHGHRLRVDRILLRNVTGTLHLQPRVLPQTKVEVRLPEQELRNVTEKYPEGVLVSELLDRVVPLVMAEMVRKGRSKLPTSGKPSDKRRK